MATVKKEISSVKNWKEISEKLLSVLLIHLTELQFPLKKPFDKTGLLLFAKRYLQALRGLW